MPNNRKGSLAGEPSSNQNVAVNDGIHTNAVAKTRQTRLSRSALREIRLTTPAYCPTPFGKATNPRDAWVAWLAPRFTDNGSAYFTGTYRDDYGYPNGLTHPRNVHKDFRRFMKELGLDGDFISGVERHQYRDILHFHAIIQGDFTPDQMDFLKRWWSIDRGFARVLPVKDGCASYVTKYALKGDTESFDWNLS